MIDQFKQEQDEKNDTSAEKDSEIEYLQGEINNLMHEKAEKEIIIKTLT